MPGLAERHGKQDLVNFVLLSKVMAMAHPLNPKSINISYRSIATNFEILKRHVHVLYLHIEKTPLDLRK